MMIISNKIKITFLSLSLFAIFAVSNFAQAALIPCGRTTGTAEETAPCTICHMVVGIKGIIDFGFKIFVIVGILMVVIAGIMYIISAGDSGMMDAAKGRLKNALIGFSVMLGAWLIINTTMYVIGTKADLGISATSWNSFTCSTASTLNTSSGAGNTSGTTNNSAIATGCCVVTNTSTNKKECYKNYEASNCPATSSYRMFIAGDANCTSAACQGTNVETNPTSKGCCAYLPGSGNTVCSRNMSQSECQSYISANSGYKLNYWQVNDTNCTVTRERGGCYTIK